MDEEQEGKGVDAGARAGGGGGPGPPRDAKKSRREVFGRFRLLGAFNGLRTVKNGSGCEKPVFGKVSGPLGADG